MRSILVCLGNTLHRRLVIARVSVSHGMSVRRMLNVLQQAGGTSSRKQVCRHDGLLCGPLTLFRTPFDCCALTFQPWTHPVLARNQDGTGCVFELTNIIPWLKSVIKSPIFLGGLILRTGSTTTRTL
jgi:hypothetical protein